MPFARVFEGRKEEKGENEAKIFGGHAAK